MKISVLCNTNTRGEEIPCAFHLGGRRLPVFAVLSRWSEASHRYFEVRVADGRQFVLRLDVAAHSWELAAVFAAAKPRAKPTSAAARPGAPRRWFAWRG